MLESSARSTLAYFQPSPQGKNHPVWSSVECSLKDVQRAQIKVRLLSGTYTLAQRRARFDKHEMSSLCPLCHGEEETVNHFLLRCSSLYDARLLLTELLCTVKSLTNHQVYHEMITNEEKLVQVIIDCSKVLILPERELCEIEQISRKLCFNLHCRRRQLIQLMGNRNSHNHTKDVPTPDDVQQAQLKGIGCMH